MSGKMRDDARKPETIREKESIAVGGETPVRIQKGKIQKDKTSHLGCCNRETLTRVDGWTFFIY